MNSYESLSRWSVLVADTGDFHLLEKMRPQDATTNPTHILKVAVNEAFTPLIDDAVKYAKTSNNLKNDKSIEQQVEDAADKVCVNFGLEILKRIPGRVSTEVDARLSFDKDAMIDKALKLVQMYESNGVNAKERVLIKIASTWEGIQAAKELQEKHGINCNLTLMFSMAQAIACAEANVKLVSPFVRRANDWYKANGQDHLNADPKTSPGVEFVKNIFHYYKKYGYKTEIMAASLTSTDLCYGLSGCDLMTVWPQCLEQMKTEDDVIEPVLSQSIVDATNPPRYPNKIHLDEGAFRYMHNLDRMAVEKVSDGIRLFAVDSAKLDDLVRSKL